MVKTKNIYFTTTWSAAHQTPVSEDAGVEPRTFATLALEVRCSNDAAISHPLLGCEDDLDPIYSIESLATDTNVLTSVPDTWHFGVDPDPQIHASVRIRMRIWILLFSLLTFKTPTKNEFKNKKFCSLHFEGTFTSFFKDKKPKKSQNSRNQGFFYFFCLMIEGSGSGSIHLTNGSWSGRPGSRTLVLKKNIMKVALVPLVAGAAPIPKMKKPEPGPELHPAIAKSHKGGIFY